MGSGGKTSWVFNLGILRVVMFSPRSGRFIHGEKSPDTHVYLDNVEQKQISDPTVNGTPICQVFQLVMWSLNWLSCPHCVMRKSETEYI
jgi:hypothetical protein